MDQNRNVKGTYEFFFWKLDQNWEYVVEKCIENSHCKNGFFKSEMDQSPRTTFSDQGKKTENDISTILVSSMLRCWIWKVKWLWMIDQPGANNYNNYNDFNHFKIISIYRGCPVALFDYFFTCSAICTSKGLSVVMSPALISVSKSKKVFRSFHR